MAVRSGIRVSFTPVSIGKLRLIQTAALTRDLTKYTEEWADDVIKALQQYPPPPGGSFQGQRRSRYGTRFTKRGEGRIGGEYERTGDLKGAWRKIPKLSGGRIAYEIQNTVRDRKRGRYYAVIVHGRGDGSGQWWFHAQTGWPRIDEVIHGFGGRAGFREGAQYIVEDNIG